MCIRDSANSTLNGVIYKNEAQVEAAHVDGEAYAGKYDVKVKTGTLIPVSYTHLRCRISTSTQVN